jgi:urease accessory protein
VSGEALPIEAVPAAGRTHDVQLPAEGAGRGLIGHLDLVCAAGADGRSFIRRQSFCAPMHLSKPHEDEGMLVVNVINPTAGMLAGDRIDCRVRVEAGARLLLTAPSASRAHCSPKGHAELVQEFEVAAGGYLDVWPELFIPQAAARYRQRTTLRIEEGGEALLFETLAPGRVAMGEAFAFTSLDWETDIVFAGETVARERYRLAPDSESIRALRGQFATGYYASCFVLSPLLHADLPCWRAIHELHGADCWIGCGPLRRGGWVIKVVAAGSVVLRRKLAAIRHELYAALGRRQPSLRRTLAIG